MVAYLSWIINTSGLGIYSTAHAQLESEYETIVSLKNAPYFATCVCLRLAVRSRMLPRKNTVRNIVFLNDNSSVPNMNYPFLYCVDLLEAHIVLLMTYPTAAAGKTLI